MIVYRDSEFVEILKQIATNYKTRYMYAAYGLKINTRNITNKANQNCNGWYTPERVRDLQNYANKTPVWWGFDCVNLIKGVLWGWEGDENSESGGAKYGANGVPDTNANGFIGRCVNVSTNFNTIQPGECLWIDGHVGVYIGDGLAVECTPRWENGVQISCVANLGKKGEKTRTWTKHGKMPWINYKVWGTESVTLGDGVLKRGMFGDSVATAQQLLENLGYSCGVYGVDGEFGGDTEKAVIRFQNDNGLFPSGAIDEPTLTALVSQDTDNEKENPVTIETNNKIKIVGDVVNVRKGNGINYEKFTAVKSGQVFEYIAKSRNNWYAMPINGVVGWVSGEYVKVV